jgi:DNA-directed RNA polymerase sigma subunit (sigma70/sigma32)
VKERHVSEKTAPLEATALFPNEDLEVSGAKAPRATETPELLVRYLARIGKGALLTHRQEVDLSRKARSGDRRARQRLIEKNLRLVVSVAKNV